MTRPAQPPRRRLLWGLAAVGAVLLVVWVRCVVEGRAELAAGQTAQDFPSKIMHFQQSMRWYAPLSGHGDEAAAHLEALAREAELSGHPDEALAAWRRLRGGIRATRHLWSPYGDRAALADERIAALMARQQLAEGGPTVRGRSHAELVADHQALLAADPTPAVGWIALISLSFLGWVASAFALSRRGFDAALVVQTGPFLRWSATTLVFFAVWLFGLWQA